MSSVPKHKRKESSVEFYHNFLKLRKEVIMILMRDFGIKQKSYSTSLIEEIYKIDNEDKKILDEIHEKYGITSYKIDKYPEWIIGTWRYEILSILNMIGIKIICANSIYINNIYDYNMRRSYWNDAIGYCYTLLDKLYEIIDCINVTLGAYEIVIEMIRKEIKLLKGVRRSDNKRIKDLKTKPWFNIDTGSEPIIIDSTYLCDPNYYKLYCENMYDTLENINNKPISDSLG